MAQSPFEAGVKKNMDNFSLGCNSNWILFFSAFTIRVVGDWILIDCPNGLRVKVDNASTVYVTLDKDKTAGETIHGLCGNNNGIPSMEGMKQ